MQLFQSPNITHGYTLSATYSLFNLFCSDSVSDESSQKNSQRASLTKLQNLLATEVCIQQASAVVQAMNETESLNSLLTAFSSLTPTDKEAKFSFDGWTYLLNQEESNVLELKNNNGEQLAKLENTSLEKLHSRVILLNLFEQLDPNAKVYFAPLFDIEKLGNITDISPMALGDLDGSSARQIVLGINTGMIRANPEAIILLAEVINAEADLLNMANTLICGYLDTSTALKIIKNIQFTLTELQNMQIPLPSEVGDVLNIPLGNAVSKLSSLEEWAIPLLLAGFQANKAIQKKMETLAKGLTYQKGHSQFLSIGDGAHDRFSTNKDVDREIREKLHSLGAIFITGNHDVFFTKDCNAITDKNKMNFLSSYGCFAKDTASATEWETHQKKVLSNAYYDQASNTLYLHHGLGATQSGILLEISSAFGYFSVRLDNKKLENGKEFNLVQLTNKLNEQALPRPNAVFQKHELNAKTTNAGDFDEFTGFRPHDDEMEKVARELKVRIVHGHNGVKNTSSPNVIGINSRKPYGFAIVAAHIGEKVNFAPSFDGEIRGTKRNFSLIADESIDDASVHNKENRVKTSKGNI